jgi:hypothetical protein
VLVALIGATGVYWKWDASDDSGAVQTRMLGAQDQRHDIQEARMVWRFVLALSLCFVAPVAARAQEPIRVGFLTFLTGALAAPGKDMENGIELFA